MPYIIKKLDKGYKVCKRDEPSTCFSNKPLPLERAKRQRTAIILSELKGGSQPTNPKLYEEVKEDVYEKIPQHSLYRSAQLVKEYKKRGGKYKGSNKDNIGKWFKQDWISLNDFVRGDIRECGDSKADEYNEKVVCRPIKIAKNLTDKQIQKLIDTKTKNPDKQVLSEKVLKTDKFNIKPTLTGTGKDKFIKQLEDNNITPQNYLKIVKMNAKLHGYDSKLLKFANNNKHKLSYNGTEFGRVGYNDFIIYLFTTDEETAFKKRNAYRKRAYKVMKETNDKYSPASLAFNILW